MRFFIGLFLGICSILLGYKIAGGEFILLWQPAELIIVLGAAIGSVVIAYPGRVLYKALSSIKYMFNDNLPKQKDYAQIISMLYNLFRVSKSKGNIGLEQHINDPAQSTIFQLSPFLLKDIHSLTFIVNCLRLITVGVNQSTVLDKLIKKQVKIYSEENENYCAFFSQLGDSLPAIGIIAAVAGVIVAMKSISGNQGALGAKIAAALIGTLLGVMISYTIVSPIGQFLSIRIEKKMQFWHCIRIGIISHLNGISPIVNAEIIRQSVIPDIRPSFQEIEDEIKNNTIKIS